MFNSLSGVLSGITIPFQWVWNMIVRVWHMIAVVLGDSDIIYHKVDGVVVKGFVYENRDSGYSVCYLHPKKWKWVSQDLREVDLCPE